VATQNISVAAGQTATATVTYALAATPPSNQSAVDACPAAILVNASATIRVFAKDQSGGALAGAQVLLTVSGSGNQYTSSLTTSASGFASTLFTSSVAEAKTITARITSAGSSVTVTSGLRVGGPTAAQLVKVAGDNQTIKVGTAGAPFVVEARNASGAPVSGVPILWQFGNCFYTTTGTDGRTFATFVEPYRTTPGGPFPITAAIPGGPSVTFMYTYVP
jgi:hypothetical protein